MWGDDVTARGCLVDGAAWGTKRAEGRRRVIENKGKPRSLAARSCPTGRHRVFYKFAFSENAFSDVLLELRAPYPYTLYPKL